MKSLTILHLLLRDASVTTGANVTRDFDTLKSRFEHEGQSFLTITLPAFGNWILTGLESQRLSSSSFTGFRLKTKAGKRMAVPCFLHGLVTKVFDEKTGNLRSDACVDSINFIWKICNIYKKQKLICSPERVRKAYESYIETDLSLRKRKVPTNVFYSYVSSKICAELSLNYTDIMSDSAEAAAINLDGLHRNRLGDVTEILFPKHGPGSTADRLLGNQKFTDRGWYSRWNGVFSWEELYGFHTIHQVEDTPSIATTKELPVRVISVPKTMKTPRIISIEPTAMQHAQQLVARRLIHAMRNSSFAFQIDISNQTTNANLALSGSKDRAWSTIDLSEASDRVSARLVRDTFATAPHISRQLFATRSRVAEFADGTQLTLAKFASMGSACTFPVETLIFYAITVSAIARWRWETIVSQGRDPTAFNSKDWRSVCDTSFKLAFAYGDDLIVPTGSFGHVVCSLEDFNLKVNSRKSFSQGSFRESCGTDAYDGVFITPLYVRRPPPATISDASELVSWIKFANNAYKHGLWNLAQGVRDWVDRKFYPLPHVKDTSPGLGWFSFLGTYSIDCWSKDLQTARVKTLVSLPNRMTDVIDGYDSLTKFFITRGHGDAVSMDADHLERSVRRDSFTIRPRKVLPY